MFNHYNDLTILFFTVCIATALNRSIANQSDKTKANGEKLSDCTTPLSSRAKRDYSSLCPNQEKIKPCICNAGYNTFTCDGINSDDRLKEIFETDFAHNRFTKMEIRNSPITTLQTGVFQKIRMHDIEIQHNDLTTVKANAFAGSERTALYINLNNNQIHDFDFRAITSIRTLRQLQLAYNQLTEIPDHAFGNLTKLDFIALNNNQIRRIGQNAFENLSSLTFLDLSHNALFQLGPSTMAFYGVDSADSRLSLVLNQNSIEHVDPNAFQGSRPTVLALVRNNLTTLEVDVFRPLLQSMNRSNNMVGLAVKDNPIMCDCRLKWLLEEPELTGSLRHFECTDGTAFVNITEEILVCT